MPSQDTSALSFSIRAAPLDPPSRITGRPEELTAFGSILMLGSEKALGSISSVT